MAAIEVLMKNLCHGIPQSVHALQLATDVASFVPFFRALRLGLGGGLNWSSSNETLCPGEWLWLHDSTDPANVREVPEASRRIILYIHGGAFALCNSATHRAITGTIVRRTGAHLLAVDYRRPPDHPAPAALNDVVDAYLMLVNRYSPSRIIVAGESAGGNLVLTLCLELRRLGHPLPGGAILVSPWVDLANFDETSWINTKDYLPLALAVKLRDAYVNGGDAQHELISPLFSENLSCLPQTLLIYGGAETLSCQCAQLFTKMRAAGVNVKVYVGEGMVHAFPLFADMAYGKLGRLTLGLSLAAAMSLVVSLCAMASVAVFRVWKPLTVSLEVVACAACVVIVFLCCWRPCRSCWQMTPLHGNWDNNDTENNELPSPLEAYRQIEMFATGVWESK